MFAFSRCLPLMVSLVLLGACVMTAGTTPTHSLTATQNHEKKTLRDPSQGIITAENSTTSENSTSENSTTPSDNSTTSGLTADNSTTPSDNSTTSGVTADNLTTPSENSTSGNLTDNSTRPPENLTTRPINVRTTPATLTIATTHGTISVGNLNELVLDLLKRVLELEGLIRGKLPSMETKLADLDSGLTTSRQDLMAILEMIQQQGNNIVPTTHIPSGDRGNHGDSKTNDSHCDCKGSLEKLSTLEEKVKDLEANQSALLGRLSQTSNTNVDFKDNVTLLEQNIRVIEENQSKVLEQIHQLSDPVYLTTCVSAKVSQIVAGDPILFDDVKVSQGLSSGSVNFIQSHGNFTCETPGTYLVTVYIVTDTVQSSFNLRKNDEVIGSAYYSMTAYYQTASITRVVTLKTDDVVSVSPRHDYLTVFGDYESCLSVVKIA